MPNSFDLNALLAQHPTIRVKNQDKEIFMTTPTVTPEFQTMLDELIAPVIPEPSQPELGFDFEELRRKIREVQDQVAVQLDYNQQMTELLLQLRLELMPA